MVLQGFGGTSALGTTATCIEVWRSKFANSTGINHGGQCVFTAICVAFGSKWDPLVLTLTDQVRRWLRVWHLFPKLRGKIRVAWRALLPKVVRRKALAHQTRLDASSSSSSAPLAPLERFAQKKEAEETVVWQGAWADGAHDGHA